MEGISIKLPLELREKLAKEAKRRNVTQSLIVRECLERALTDAQEQTAANCADLLRPWLGTLRSGRKDLGTNSSYLDEAIVKDAVRDTKRRR